MDNLIKLQELMNLAIVGAALSLVIEFIQRKFSVDGGKAKALTIVLALIVGTGYVLLRDTNYWVTLMAILSAASFVYAIFIPSRKKKEEEFEG
jgi:hypothetical protein